MARTPKNTVSYFPHDANACSGDTMTVLQNRYGNDGYAFWFKLLEKLALADGHYIDCRNSVKWNILLAKTGVNELTGLGIMTLLVEMNAIDKDLWGAKIIWCQNLVDNLSDVYKNRKREMPQKPIITGDDVITTGSNAKTTVEIPQSKVNKIKENNGKKIIDKEKLSTPLGNNLRQVFKRIDEIRGYKPPKRKAEAASIMRMLKKYTPDQIIDTWEKMKKEPFWNGKELFMMSVESQIGALVTKPNMNTKAHPYTEFKG